MKVKLKDKWVAPYNKRPLFIGNYYDNEMCCFKREMIAPKRLIESKAWCQLSFLLELLSL